MHKQSDLDAVLSAFFSSRESAHSRRSYKHDWGAFEAWCAPQGLGVLAAKPVDVLRYLSSLKDENKARATRGRALSVIRSVYDALVVHGFVQTNPAKSVKNPKSDATPKTPWLDEAGIKRFMAELPPQDTWQNRRDRLAVLLLVGLGWRRSEVARIQLEDFDQMTLTGIVKGGKRATVGVPAWLWREIGAWRDWARLGDEGPLLPSTEGSDKSMSDTRLHGIVAAIAERAGVTVTPHGLRRTYITTLRGRGADLKTLQLAVAHSSSATTERYDRARQVSAPGEDLEDLVYGKKV